jgi:hypothetical protein
LGDGLGDATEDALIVHVVCIARLHPI